jgi:hypothetical protein
MDKTSVILYILGIGLFVYAVITRAISPADYWYRRHRSSIVYLEKSDTRSCNVSE